MIWIIVCVKHASGSMWHNNVRVSTIGPGHINIIIIGTRSQQDCLSCGYCYKLSWTNNRRNISTWLASLATVCYDSGMISCVPCCHSPHSQTYLIYIHVAFITINSMTWHTMGLRLMWLLQPVDTNLVQPVVNWLILQQGYYCCDLISETISSLIFWYLSNNARTPLALLCDSLWRVEAGWSVFCQWTDPLKWTLKSIISTINQPTNTTSHQY